MKTIFNILILMLVCAGSIFGQAPFLKSYGGSGSDFGKAVIECSTGGYLVVGSTNSFYDVSTDIYVLRLTEGGEYIWGRNIGAENQIEWGNDVKESSDGAFYISGITNDNASNNYDGILVKIDADGNELWTKTYGGPDWDFIENMAITTDDEIILAGQLSQEGWLLKTDAEGEVIWEQTFEGTGSVALTGVDLCENGSIAIVGYNDYTPLNTQTQITGILNTEGEIDWVSAFPEMGNLVTKNCVCRNSNEVLSTGTLIAADIDKIHFSAIDISIGLVLWTKQITWNASGESGAINHLEDGHIILAASLPIGFGLDELDGLIHKRESNGDYISIEFGPVFGGYEHDKLHGIIPTSDGGYTAVGETSSFGNNRQVMLTHIMADGSFNTVNEDFLDIATPVAEIGDLPVIKLWPNPAKTQLQIEMFGQNNADYHSKITDITGQVLKSMNHNQKGGKIVLDIATLQNGVYFLTVYTSNGMIHQQRFVKVQ